MNLLNKINQNAKEKFNEINKKIKISKKISLGLKLINGNQKLIIRENNKIKLIGDFHFFGVFNTDNKIWTWGNIIPNISRDSIDYVEKLRMKGYLFETMKNNNQSTMFFYQFLTNDSMYIPEKKYLGLICDLLLYISDDMYIFSSQNENNDLQFVGLSKINELY